MEEPRGLRLGSIGGTAIYMDPTFFILAAVFVMLDLERGKPIQYALLWIPTLLISLLFHEFGHAATIGSFGFGRSVIILGGFGGVTMNVRRSKPWKEILIAGAGPAGSLLLVVLLTFAFRSIPFLYRDAMFSELMPLMIWANINWAIFNLFPIYPLDGGQMLNQFSRYFTTRDRATKFSAMSSLVLAAAILIFSVLSRNFFLAALIAMMAMQNFQRLQYGDRDL